MRHQRPKVVIDYYEAVDAFFEIKEPQCCHTCEHYDENGICQEFLEAPPADFAEKLNQCDKWMMIIPF